MKKLKLPNVTIIGIDCVNVERLQEAMDVCEKEIEFGASKLLTSLPTDDKRFIKIPHLGSIEAYSDFCIRDLNDYIDTDFVLIVQHDGFILNPSSWSDDFLKYDYIGAPWNVTEWSSSKFKIPVELIGQSIVGNGGFCIRSKRFLELSSRFFNEGKIPVTQPEDTALCVWHRDLFEKEDMKYAPVEVAKRFSLEGEELIFDKQFGFHGFAWTRIDSWVDKHPEYKIIANIYNRIWNRA